MHGGDIYRNKVKYDFSVNTNPLGMPPEVAAALSEAVFDADKYPDLIHEELINETAKVLGIEPFRIVYGNGASEILMALCHAALPEKILVTAPSFLGYTNIIHKAYKDCGIVYHYLSEVEDFELKDDILELIEMEAPSILFLTNPNNPNGRFVDKSLLERIVSKCDETGTVLLLDECFLPLSGADKERSMIPKISEHGNIVVLRAFTKSFAMAGVRLGYAVCGDKALAEAIRAHLPEWNLSLFAQRAGVAGLGHLDVIQQAAEYIAKENCLVKLSDKDVRKDIAGRQGSVADAPVFIVLTADLNRYRMKGDMTARFGAIDCGYVSQNICLACEALGLKTVPRAGMDENVLKKELDIQDGQLLLINHPVGYQK